MSSDPIWNHAGTRWTFRSRPCRIAQVTKTTVWFDWTDEDGNVLRGLQQWSPRDAFFASATAL